MTFEELKRKCNERSQVVPVAVHRSKGHAEDDLQKDCVSWFRDSFPELAMLLFHPNNEAFFGKGRDKRQQERAGKRAKDMGVVPGVADLVLLYPASRYHGLLVEMKTPTGRQSDSQKQWQKVVESYGYRYAIIRTRKDFRRLVEEYTGMRPKDADEVAIEKLFGHKVRVVKK